MAAFVSTSYSSSLDGLTDVSGFSQARAGVAYSFYRDAAGGNFRPLPSSEAGASVDPNGGLEKNASGQLKVKPNLASGDSGISLGSDGLAVINRVKTAGDTMTGALKVPAPSDTDDATNKVYVDTADDSLQTQINDIVNVITAGEALQVTSQSIGLWPPFTPLIQLWEKQAETGHEIDLVPLGMPIGSTSTQIYSNVEDQTVTVALRATSSAPPSRSTLVTLRVIDEITGLEVRQVSLSFPGGADVTRTAVFRGLVDPADLPIYRFVTAESDTIITVDSFDVVLSGNSSGPALVLVDPNGGLEKNASGELKIKPNGSADDSGVGLSSGGLLVTNRVKKTGDDMSGVLKIRRDQTQSSIPSDDSGFNLIVENFAPAAPSQRAKGVKIRTYNREGSELLHFTDQPSQRGFAFDIWEANGLRLRSNNGSGGSVGTGAFVWGLAGDANSNQSRRLTDLAAPTAAQDAATKAYVDERVKKSGDAMTGQLSVRRDQAAGGVPSDDAAFPLLVENLASSGSGTRARGIKVRVNTGSSGGAGHFVGVSENNLAAFQLGIVPGTSSASGLRIRVNDGAGSTLGLGENNCFVFGAAGLGTNSNEGRRLINLGPPTGAADAATKAYVDSAIRSLSARLQLN